MSQRLIKTFPQFLEMLKPLGIKWFTQHTSKSGEETYSIDIEEVDVDGWTTEAPTFIGWYWALPSNHDTPNVFYFDGTLMWQGSSRFAVSNFSKFGKEMLTPPNSN